MFDLQIKLQINGPMANAILADNFSLCCRCSIRRLLVIVCCIVFVKLSNYISLNLYVTCYQSSPCVDIYSSKPYSRRCSYIATCL